jgi:hypothetical protein
MKNKIFFNHKEIIDFLCPKTKGFSWNVNFYKIERKFP